MEPQKQKSNCTIRDSIQTRFFTTSQVFLQKATTDFIDPIISFYFRLRIARLFTTWGSSLVYGRIPGLTIRTHFYSEPVQMGVEKAPGYSQLLYNSTRVEIALAFRKGFGETSFHVRKKILMLVFEAAWSRSFHLCLSLCKTKISMLTMGKGLA